ncbi:MAG: GNAT family N-acetyltransferase [Deltaproteobacteria bacterium]|nr:GNAT family N-acetyltransferase [Deltaproteobacteria bacterium]
MGINYKMRHKKAKQKNRIFDQNELFSLRSILVWYTGRNPDITKENTKLRESMTSPNNYPTKHLFISHEWQSRVAALGLKSPAFYVTRMFGLKVAFMREGLWNDFEEWPGMTPSPIETKTSPDEKVDWVVRRKLLAELTDEETVRKIRASRPFLRRPYFFEYSTSPYLELEKPIPYKKSSIAHIHRTERKITRELGAPILTEFKTQEERIQWFNWYSTFQRHLGRMSDDQYEILKKWTTEGEKPEWMWLMGLMVNGVPLVVGLFYFWDGVFYYFGSSMNPDPQYRKYGPGKMFVEKLIQHTKAQGGLTFDFLQGAHEYKAHWNPQIRVIYQSITPRSLKGFIALTLFRVKRKFKKDEQFEGAEMAEHIDND